MLCLTQVTSVCFSPDGLTVVGGLMNGQVYFYNYEGMKYLTQMNCKNRAGKFKKGSKVTGLSFFKNDNDNMNMPHSYPFSTLPPLLVTTNDNRLRLFSLSDFSMTMKYKGLKNSKMQIKANFSDDRKHIICGSESGEIVVWETEPPVSDVYSFSSLFGEQKIDRNCSCEVIANTSREMEENDIEVYKNKKSHSMSKMIGQKNKKRIRTAYKTLFKRSRRNIYETGKRHTLCMKYESVCELFYLIFLNDFFYFTLTIIVKIYK